MKESNFLYERARKALNLAQYNEVNRPQIVAALELQPPEERQYVLRMLVRIAPKDFEIPEELQWTIPLVKIADKYQITHVGIQHQFTYITVRHGIVTSEEDDEWHVDGFSMRINHLPEQNYVWTSNHPTEFAIDSYRIPLGFDPLVHNIHQVFQRKEPAQIFKGRPKTVYAFDPYCVHRRPTVPPGTHRTFVRVSFVPIEINDVNNTQNPLIHRDYEYNGLDFRHQLRSPYDSQ